MMKERDRIAEIFSGKSIFITGGTGFMGKVLIERLLRTTEVNKIYILTRSKRNDTSHERFLKLLNNSLFAKLKDKMSVEEILNKIHLINGDCSKVDLDLSDDDRQLIIENVSMIFNFAATVSFNAKFKYAMELNLRSVRDLMKLAKECKHLEIFCHLSTAYCHLSEKVLLEKSYNHQLDPSEIIDFVEHSSDEEIHYLLSKYIDKNTPSSYGLSKALAEKLILQMNNELQLPVIICRPGIVLSTYSDPMPGWTDNFQSFNGFTITICTGILRSFYVKSKTYNFKTLPVDIAIGNIMLCIWNYTNEKKSPETEIYNLKSCPFDPLESLPNDYDRVRNECLIGGLSWYPKLKVTDKRWLHVWRTFWYHRIGAFIQDLFLMIFGYKAFVLKTHRKLAIGMKIFNASLHQNYECGKIKRISKDLSEKERMDYVGDNYDKETFRLVYLRGLRKYLLKRDNEVTVENCKILYDLFYILDNVVKFVTFVFIGRILYRLLK